MNSIQDILKRLPHRPPFLLIDRIIEINPEQKTIKALKNVTINEPFFAGHFPQRPVMPGVLIVEALAQACAFLGVETCKPTLDDSLFLLTGIGETRFKRIVEPGDQLILEACITSDRHHLLKCEARASVNGETVCTTKLTSMRKEIEP